MTDTSVALKNHSMPKHLGHGSVREKVAALESGLVVAARMGVGMKVRLDKVLPYIQSHGVK